MNTTEVKPIKKLMAEIRERNRNREIDEALSAVSEALEMISFSLADLYDEDGTLAHLKEEEREAVRAAEHWVGEAEGALGDLGEVLS